MPSTIRRPTASGLRQQFHLSISHILQQVQDTIANHRKNYVTLYKVHTEAAAYTEESSEGLITVGENLFWEAFASRLLRAFTIKKGVAVADNVLKFVGGYIRHMNEKAIEEREHEVGDAEEEEATPASRFTGRLLSALQQAFHAKDKNVRYRVLFTLLQMIAHLGEIDEDVYNDLVRALVERINDKEASIRSIAAICLAKLAVSEGSSEVEEIPVLAVLLEAMSYDSSAEVRRAILMNVPLDNRTFPAVLDRTRDTDQSIRKLVYGNVLLRCTQNKDDATLNAPGSESTHPRMLSIEQRELIVKNGLGDRDPTVKSAAAILISKWMKLVTEDEILSLLSLFDLNSDTTVAFDALQSVFQTQPEIFENLDFNVEYWKNLTAGKAFLARAFVDYCKSAKEEARLECALPVVTAIAFQIQDAYNHFVDFLVKFDALHASEDVDEKELNKLEEEKHLREFILAELLKLATNLDYSDEIGRRKTFQLVRDMLDAELLPEVLMGPCLDVLRELSATERDLIRLVVEIVQELRDGVIEGAEETEDPNQSLDVAGNPTPIPAPCAEMTPVQQMRLDAIDSKCLTMCIGMLERVNGTFEENITLHGILKTLIIPSALKEDGLLRERGTKALALCCLIDRRIAEEFFKIFIQKLSTSPASIRVVIAHALIDICMVHKKAIFRDESNNLEMTTHFLLSQVRKEQDPEVQAILCQGVAKLVIAKMITDIEAIKTLLKIYISPLTVGNAILRQSLNLFFNIYSFSSLENQQRMQEIFLLIFLDVCEDHRQAIEVDEDVDVVESNQIASMFVMWTDPLQLSKAINKEDVEDGKIANECIQLDMARDIITLLFEKDLKIEIEREDKRVLCQLLNKLYIPDTVDRYRIRSMKLLMVNLRARRPLRDHVSKTAFSKFEATFTKKFEKLLEDFSEEEFRKLEELDELFMFLDSIFPPDDEETTETDIPRKRGRKRYSFVNLFCSAGLTGNDK
ncbi:hypothetical protein HYPSUDRAFT_131697 [Hypholoma sublateritium FD-334 SS-4]|uniref:Nuclear condensin complex subunit 3 C-terminal domain-containing protein n=1 Tax=Hypholoma sublateritium (strain FD-334 SS-4) TaxID=945553 RepID=A0A0D2P7X5_HYPSF|nr:hypothetical protein HYPSUDRAFT_131697 [Hypholoma sublateritium FD-334 SS-4]